MKKEAKKAVSKEMREKAENAFTELQYFPNRMFRLVKVLKVDSKEAEGERCCVSVRRREVKSGRIIWKGS